MNERIKELAKQADPDYTGIYDDDMGHALVGEEVIKKFAELIVQKCAAKCEEVAVGADKVANGKFVTDAGRMLHQGMWGGAKNCAAMIKSHFEIEE